MSNDVINTTTATTPFTALDAEKLAAAGPAGQDIFRERVQVTGASLAEVARVQKTPPTSSDYGLVMRQPGDAQNFDVQMQILESLLRIERYLAAMSDEHISTHEDKGA